MDTVHIVRIAPTEGNAGNILEIECDLPSVAAAYVQAALEGKIYKEARPEFLNVSIRTVRR